MWNVEGERGERRNLKRLSCAYKLCFASSAMVTAEHWESSIDAPPGHPMRLCLDLDSPSGIKRSNHLKMV
jgi:hypothetical protein